MKQSFVKPGIEPDMLHTPLRITAANPKCEFVCNRHGQWSYCRACDDYMLRYIGHGGNLPAYVRKQLVWRIGVAELKNSKEKGMPAPRRMTARGREYQPQTGTECDCRQGKQRSSCNRCEGTGMVVDHARLRRETAERVGIKS